MKVLLSDGAGLTARQTATLLAGAGHRVEVLSPDPFCLCRFTVHVRRVHRAPPWTTVCMLTASGRHLGGDLRAGRRRVGYSCARPG